MVTESSIEGIHLTEVRFYRITILIGIIAVCALTAAAQIDTFNESWRWVHFTTESGLPSSNVSDIVETPDSTLRAIAGAGGAIYKLAENASGDAVAHFELPVHLRGLWEYSRGLE